MGLGLSVRLRLLPVRLLWLWIRRISVRLRRLSVWQLWIQLIRVTTTAPVMDIADMGTTTAPVTDTSMAADQSIPRICGGGDKPRLRLFEIAGLLMRVDQVCPSDASIRRQDHREE